MYKVLANHICLSSLFNLLAVRALFLVLCPLTGNPEACLIPA